MAIIRREYGSSGAEFSDCEQYRYSLWRTWTNDGLNGRLCAFIGLNPSTATETVDDPTIRRCVGFCKSWGFDGYVMLNLFAFRATDPRDMKAHVEPIGDRNTYAILNWANCCSQIVAAWGNHGTHLNRAADLSYDLRDHGYKIHHLGLTKTSQPKHPLYLRADTQPVVWE